MVQALIRGDKNPDKWHVNTHQNTAAKTNRKALVIQLSAEGGGWGGSYRTILEFLGNILGDKYALKMLSVMLSRKAGPARRVRGLSIGIPGAPRWPHGQAGLSAAPRWELAD